MINSSFIPNIRRVALAAPLVFSTALMASNGTWTAGSGDWATDTNWLSLIIPGASGTTDNTDRATFNSSGAGGVVTVDEGWNVFGITFSTNAYTLQGGTLVLTAGGDITGSSGSMTIDSNLLLQGNATFTGSGTGGAITVNGGISGTATAGNTYTLTLAGNATTNKISRVISDGVDGGTLKLSVGNLYTAGWELSSANTYTGGTSLAGGSRLLVSNGSALGTGDVTITNGSSTSSAQYGQLRLSGDISLDLGATGIFKVTSGAAQAGGMFRNMSGNNTVVNNIESGGHLYLESSAGKITFTGNIYSTYAGGSTGATRTLGLMGDGDGEISGQIYNTSTTRGWYAINKTGNGTWTISNPGTGTDRNTYKGSTTVNAGALYINADNTLATGAITVNSGGTFGGNGISGGAATFSAGSFLSPGAAAGEMGTKTFLSTVDISGLTGGTDGGLLFQLGSSGSSDMVALSSDVLTIGTGTLSLADFNFTVMSGFGEGVYTLFDTTQSISGTLAAENLTGTLDGYNIALSLGNSDQDIILTVTSIPEPSTFAALFGSLALMVAASRRRR